MNRWRSSLLVCLTIIILTFVSCGNNDGTSPEFGNVQGEFGEMAMAISNKSGMASTAPMVMEDMEYASRPSSGVETADRLTVKNASLDLVVDNVPETLAAISVFAQSYGGFVVTSQVGGEGIHQFAWISLRIPAEQLGPIMSEIRSLGVRVTGETTSTRDVTEEHIDLKSRLQVLEETLDQYLRLLERAKTVEDILRVQKEATKVQSEIEQLKGRINYLERTSATSLLNVNLQPSTNQDPLVKPGWSPIETIKSALRGLTGFGQALADTVIGIAVFSPVWLPFLGIFWLGIRWFRRRKRE